LALFQRGGVGGEERKTDGEPRESNVVVDARGGNSHEAGGRRLAVLKLSPGPDWPCTRCSLVTVLLLENWRGAEFPKPSLEGFRSLSRWLLSSFLSLSLSLSLSSLSFLLHRRDRPSIGTRRCYPRARRVIDRRRANEAKIRAW